MYTSQSSISAAIKNLETELGVDQNHPLLVYREEAFGQAQEIFLDEVLRYLESYQEEK